MTTCQSTMLEKDGHKYLCANAAEDRVYLPSVDRVLNMCPLCMSNSLAGEGMDIPKTTIPEMLKGVLGDTRDGPSIRFENNEFVLYSCGVMCRHSNWEVFMSLCAEYSDYIEGQEHDITD